MKRICLYAIVFLSIYGVMTRDAMAGPEHEEAWPLILDKLKKRHPVDLKEFKYAIMAAQPIQRAQIPGDAQLFLQPEGTFFQTQLQHNTIYMGLPTQNAGLFPPLFGWMMPFLHMRNRGHGDVLVLDHEFGNVRLVSLSGARFHNLDRHVPAFHAPRPDLLDMQVVQALKEQRHQALYAAGMTGQPTEPPRPAFWSLQVAHARAEAAALWAEGDVSDRGFRSRLRAHLDIVRHYTEDPELRQKLDMLYETRAQTLRRLMYLQQEIQVTRRRIIVARRRVALHAGMVLLTFGDMWYEGRRLYHTEVVAEEKKRLANLVAQREQLDPVHQKFYVDAMALLKSNR